MFKLEKIWGRNLNGKMTDWLSSLLFEKEWRLTGEFFSMVGDGVREKKSEKNSIIQLIKLIENI